MRSFCLLISRFCLAAWVGTATFFVFVVIGLRRPDLFTSEIMLNHPRILFPLFYGFEFSLLGTAFVCGLLSWGHSATSSRAYRAHLGLVALGLLIAAGDYLAVYRPLAAMIERPTLPMEFTRLHHISRWTNAAGLAVCMIATALSLWTTGEHTKSAP